MKTRGRCELSNILFPKERCYLTGRRLDDSTKVCFEYSRDDRVSLSRGVFRKKPVHKVMGFLRRRLIEDPQVTEAELRIYPTSKMIRNYHAQSLYGGSENQAQ